MNLVLFLAARYLEGAVGAGVAPSDSDGRLQEFESHLEEDEPALLQAYLDLNTDELESLPPELHEWFLTRLAIGPPLRLGEVPQHAAAHLSSSFFAAERSMQRYLTICALLAFDEKMEAQERSSVAMVWERIWIDRGAEGEKAGAIGVVTEILLDQCYFCRRSRYPLLALRQLLQWERKRVGLRERGPVSDRIAARGELLGGRLGEELERLLREV